MSTAPHTPANGRTDTYAGEYPRDRWREVGDLTIHGVTRFVELAAEQTGRGTNPWGTEVAGYAATAKISRKDFGMQFNLPLDGGGWLVGDEVKIAIDVQAIRQD